ncbi:hypothetical protein BST65_17410 [Bradyrhizobium canariense]|nr:hypothetical protein BST65_17410 [Bradyrhizobium canariense]OSI29634.1 hypothetical protein BST66_24920 [Bradyrhizobium canariense]OSI46465.1 hypothetical protein BSZ20_10515 [Bradyrhizobium canariense]OSI53904.1 hypothetical protein BST67_07920 [Bradyrhizobium canariense]OSI56854.1 hypothetical protein BSZ15_15415 [Bradyrhizobium canariense]
MSGNSGAGTEFQRGSLAPAQQYAQLPSLGQKRWPQEGADLRPRIPSLFASGAVDGALAGEPAPDPVVVGRFVELVVVRGALVWSDATVWLPVL